MKIQKPYRDLYRVNPPQGRAAYLRLDMNENPDGLPQDFFDSVMKTITPSLLATYPETGRLVGLLADYLGVNDNQVMVTNGSDEALKLIFEVFGGPGQKLVSVWPTFAMYMVYGKMRGMTHVEIPYKEDFSVDVEDILAAIDQDTAIVSLLNPNNPIGNVYTEAEVEAIIEKARQCDALVIIDEAYYYFYDRTFIELCKKADNVVLVRTFSKLCSIAGLRVGYVVSQPDLIQYLFNARPSYSVNNIALRFAEEIIQRKDLIDRLIEVEREGRSYIISQLKNAEIPYYAENGNYVFIHCGSNKQKLADTLKELGVLVKVYENDPLLQEYIRISTGGKEQMEMFWNKFIEARERLK